MELGLKNKVAMVGGASKGLGFAVARALAAEGARVSIASRDRDAIQRAADRIAKETGGQTLANPVDLSKADVVMLYLLPTLNVKLIPQFQKLKPGARIVSHAFDMKGIQPDKVISFT